MNVNVILKFKAEIERLLPLERPLKIAVAVSGGSDSLALAFLLNNFFKVNKGELFCITIDHCLRAESANEARKVNEILSSYGIKHEIISWDEEKSLSNLQEKARLARYNLLTDFCLSNDIDYLATAHQQNDQAENFIIRAQHGSGVYGLSGIPAIGEFNRVKIIRPLLEFRKEELQEFLKDIKVEWIEDPSNQNEKFARVRARKFLGQYPKLIAKLASISKNLAKTKICIEYMLDKEMREIVERLSPKIASIDLEKFNQLPQEIRFRMLALLLQEISGEFKMARGERIEGLIAKLEQGMEFKASTLSKCLISRKKNKIIITNELA